MSPGRSRDAAGVGCLLAVAAGLALATHGARWLDALRQLPGHLAAGLTPLRLALLGLLVVASFSGLLVGRARLAQRLLARRARWTLLPADTFDPPVEAAVRFAGQLARVQRRGWGWIERPGSAVRLRLDSTGAGQMTYGLDAPQRARPVVLAAIGEYPEVELRERPDPAERPPGVARVRAELVLARPAFEPLAELGLDPDPLSGLTGVFGALRDDLAESATVAIDVLPCLPRAARRARRRLARDGRRANHDWDAGQPPPPGQTSTSGGQWLGGVVRFDDLLPGGAHGERQDPIGLAQRQARVQAMRSKLAGDAPLLAIQILLRVESRSEARAKSHLQALLSAFDMFAGRNHWRAVGLPVGDGFMFGSDGRWRRRWCDRRLETGWFGPPRRNLVVAREIAGLLKPPTARCHAHNVVRSGGVIAPAPAGLPTFEPGRGLLPLGRIIDHRGERVAGVPLADTFFEYVCGRSRYGKTELGLVQFIALARSGHGAFFLDPHADAIEHAKGYLTDPGVRDRVVEVNLATAAARERQLGWNPLAARGLPAEQAEARVQALTDAFASALGWTERNTRALTITTHATRALIELARRLPAEHAPTVFQIPTLLGNDHWRQAVLPFLSAPTRAFFVERFPRLSSEAITPVTNLIDRLRASTPVTALLGASTSTYDVRRAMDAGLIVLACPGEGDTIDRLVANFLVFDLLHAAKARVRVAPEARRPFAVFLDEVQSYDGSSAGTLAALLEQTAKYGLRGYFFNQNPERLTPDTLTALTTNRSHLITTAVNARAAALLAREWGGAPSAETVAGLDRFTYVAAVTLDGRTPPPFLVAGLPARELWADAHNPEAVGELDAAIEQTTARRPVAETIAALDALDDTILGHLAGPKEHGGDAGTVEVDLAPAGEGRW